MMGIPTALKLISFAIMASLVLLPMAAAGKKNMFLTGTFKIVSTAGTKLEMYKSTQLTTVSCLRCGSLCVRKRTKEPPCYAVSCDAQERMCYFYTQGSVRVQPPGVRVYLFQVRDVFHSISVGEKQFSIYLSSVKKTHSAARAHCIELGGYLLEFSSLEEYDAIEMITATLPRVSSYVGANDIEKEGQFVTERDGKPIDPKLWLWKGAEGSLTKSGENCVLIASDIMQLWDLNCNSRKQYLCEKDV